MQVTVTDLMSNFADACRCLVPSLDRASVPWRDGEQYDNWDRIAIGLFETLVTEPCAFQAVGGNDLTRLRIARYGFASEVGCNAWVASESNPDARVITLSSLAKPFDHVLFEEPIGIVPLESNRFIFVYDVGDGVQWLENVDLSAE